MNNYLLITLGHGSSAIYVDNSGDKQNIIGYEQERLSRIKSDSQFPIDAVHEIMHNVGIAKMKGCKVLISHWFNNFDEENMQFNKYLPKECFEELCEIASDIKFTCGNKFSHHDAHAYSAYAFYRYNSEKFVTEKRDSAPIHFIVADGFGNDEEVLSIYRVDNTHDDLHLISRTYGYDYSLGLMYQYATSFVGMKENRDEYKFLGYESHILEFYDIEDVNKIAKFAGQYISMFIKNIGANKRTDIKDGIIDFDELRRTKNFWYRTFAKLLDVANAADSSCDKKRAVVAYFIQYIVENVMKEIIKEFNIRHLCVAGGCFFNVKLNNAILNSIDGHFCVMPLAGDQGAAIGMYDYECDIDFEFKSLSWGKRRLYNIEKFCDFNRMHVIKVKNHDYSEAIKVIANIIAKGEIVDLIHGNMEFGPRALCNTSTIFLPFETLVAKNNKMNKRNEVMPCAPVCTAGNAVKLFDVSELLRVIGSDSYMICTHEYKNRNKVFTYSGVMHKMPLSLKYTGRPQVICNDGLMSGILQKVQDLTDIRCLVNTSFNAHGNPIVFDTAEIISNYKYQCEHLDETESKPYLIVVIDED